MARRAAHTFLLFTLCYGAHWVHVSVLPGELFTSLGVVHTNDLVYPANEGRHLDIDPGHVFPATAEAPGDKACKGAGYQEEMDL